MGKWADLDLINGYKKIISSILFECDTKRT